MTITLLLLLFLNILFQITIVFMMNTSADPLPPTYPVAGGNLGGSLHAVGGGGGAFEDHLMVNWWYVYGDLMGI